ncbi:hypothetical protein AMECASPLE_038712 [Ameca splendens]|uniref:Uncharacterized protein n=1 Tax=Ameca splendens TaxID=208324 RepID=A0ABV0XLD0_9TELE
MALSTQGPSVFNGDPFHFIELKISFMSFIDVKAISSADKLYYLRLVIELVKHWKELSIEMTTRLTRTHGKSWMTDMAKPSLYREPSETRLGKAPTQRCRRIKRFRRFRDDTCEES